MPKHTVAFAGSGESSFANTRDLLNDFLGVGPEDKEGWPEIPRRFDVEFILPLSEDHLNDHLLTAWEYTDYCRASDQDPTLPYLVVFDDQVNTRSGKARKLLEYAESDKEVTNVNRTLIDTLVYDREHGREVALVLFWDDEDPICEALLDAALSADIKVYDITEGLEPLRFPDTPVDEEPAAEPEPEPEPEEKPTRRRGRAREAANGRDKAEVTDEDVKEAADILEESKGDVFDDVNAAARTTLEAAKTRIEVVRDAYQHLYSLLGSHVPASVECEYATARLAESSFWAVTALETMAKEVIEEVQPKAEEPEEKPKRGRGRPRNDGAAPTPRTPAQRAKTEIWNEETEEWEPKGPGRVPRGAKTRKVDPKTGDVVED